MASYLARLNFIILPVHKSYRPIVNEHTKYNYKPIQCELDDNVHSLIRNWKIHFYMGVLYAVGLTPKIF